MKGKKFSNGYFDIDSLTDFVCPECNIGLLEAKKENIKEFEHKEYNKRLSQDDDYEMHMFRNDFCGFLQCNNFTCSEKIVVAGEILLEEIITYELKIIKKYSPTHFGRSPHIIEISGEYPEKIKLILLESFSLFWLNKSSCANRVRMCIEKVMDEFGVKKHDKNNDIMSLHNRIELFAKDNKDLKEIILAIKWIGNEGSHSSVNVENLLDGYWLADYMLKKLFKKEEKSKSEIELSKEINEVRGRNRV